MPKNITEKKAVPELTIACIMCKKEKPLFEFADFSSDPAFLAGLALGQAFSPQALQSVAGATEKHSRFCKDCTQKLQLRQHIQLLSIINSVPNPLDRAFAAGVQAKISDNIRKAVLDGMTTSQKALMYFAVLSKDEKHELLSVLAKDHKEGNNAD